MVVPLSRNRRRASPRPRHLLAGAVGVERLPGPEPGGAGPRPAVHPAVGRGGGRRLRENAGLASSTRALWTSSAGRWRPRCPSTSCCGRSAHGAALPAEWPMPFGDHDRGMVAQWVHGAGRTCRAGPGSLPVNAGLHQGPPRAWAWRSPGAGWKAASGVLRGRRPGGRRPGRTPRDPTGRSGGGRRPGSGRPTLRRPGRQLADNSRASPARRRGERHRRTGAALHGRVAPAEVGGTGTMVEPDERERRGAQAGARTTVPRLAEMGEGRADVVEPPPPFSCGLGRQVRRLRRWAGAAGHPVRKGGIRAMRRRGPVLPPADPGGPHHVGVGHRPPRPVGGGWLRRSCRPPAVGSHASPPGCPQGHDRAR